MVQVLNNASHLAVVEVAVAYLRQLLKVHDLNKYLQENPTCRQEIVEAKIQESSPFFKFIFSSMHIDLEDDAKTHTAEALLEKLLNVHTQIDVIQQEQENNTKAIDKLKNSTRQQSHFAWSYEKDEPDEVTGSVRVDFDDQICLLLESHRDKCNKAKSQREVNEFCRVSISSTMIVDVVDCKLFICCGDEPMSARMVYRQECGERRLGDQSDKLRLTDGFCIEDEYEVANPSDGWAHLARTTLKSKTSQTNLTGLPSWSEVKEGILIEEVHDSMARMKSTQNKTLEKLVLATKLKLWSQTFAKLKIPVQDEAPIALLELEDPFSQTCKALFQLYTMESIVHRALNQAAINRLDNKRNSIGRFAACLSKALQYAEKNKVDSTEEQFTVYRGVALPDGSEVRKYEASVGKLVNIRGYTSAYRDREAALSMALSLSRQQLRMQPVLVEMVLPKGAQSGFCFTLNHAEHTIYPQQ